MLFCFFLETSKSWFYLRPFLSIILMIAQITLLIIPSPRLNPEDYLKKKKKKKQQQFITCHHNKDSNSINLISFHFRNFQRAGIYTWVVFMRRDRESNVIHYNLLPVMLPGNSIACSLTYLNDVCRERRSKMMEE